MSCAGLDGSLRSMSLQRVVRPTPRPSLSAPGRSGLDPSRSRSCVPGFLLKVPIRPPVAERPRAQRPRPSSIRAAPSCVPGFLLQSARRPPDAERPRAQRAPARGADLGTAPSCVPGLASKHSVRPPDAERPRAQRAPPVVLSARSPFLRSRPCFKSTRPSADAERPEHSGLRPSLSARSLPAFLAS